MQIIQIVPVSLWRRSYEGSNRGVNRGYEPLIRQYQRCHRCERYRSIKFSYDRYRLWSMAPNLLRRACRSSIAITPTTLDHARGVNWWRGYRSRSTWCHTSALRSRATRTYARIFACGKAIFLPRECIRVYQMWCVPTRLISPLFSYANNDELYMAGFMQPREKRRSVRYRWYQQRWW